MATIVCCRSIRVLSVVLWHEGTAGRGTRFNWHSPRLRDIRKRGIIARVEAYRANTEI